MRAPSFISATVVALAASSAFATPAPEQPLREVKARWELGAATKWDYAAFDSTHKRVFFSRGDHVDVVDAGSGKVIGQIAHTAGVHGVAFAPDLKLGFTSNGRDNSVTVFDLDTLQVKQVVPVKGGNPDAILYDAHSKQLYTFNGKSNDISVFDAVSLRQMGQIAVGGRPEFAAADNAGHIYLNLEDKGEVVVVDLKRNAVQGRWPLPGCEEPSGLALDADNGRVFSVCANKVMAISDVRAGRMSGKVEIGSHPDAVVYDPVHATVVSSNGEGSLSVIRQIDADHYAPAITIPTAKGARTLAYDPASGKAFLPTAINGVFTVLVVGQ